MMQEKITYIWNAIAKSIIINRYLGGETCQIQNVRSIVKETQSTK